MSLFLENQLHERVELPEAIAKKLFKTVAETEDIVNVAAGERGNNSGGGGGGNGVAVGDRADLEDVEDDEDEEEEVVPLKLSDLEYDKATLEATVYYAMLPDKQRTVTIQKPLPRPLAEVVYPWELEFMRKAEREGYHVQLLDIASYLKFEQLLNLCAAYLSVRLDEIARSAPTIMDGAERIRVFLQMENEWTEEEMVHLQKEMEYAKQVDPRVY